MTSISEPESVDSQPSNIYNNHERCHAAIGQGGDPVKKALPIGIENFEDMVKSGYYYVDKTLQIGRAHV